MKVKEVVAKLQEFDQEVDCIFSVDNFYTVDAIQTLYGLPEPVLFGQEAEEYSERNWKAYENSEEARLADVQGRLARISRALQTLKEEGWYGTVERG